MKALSPEEHKQLLLSVGTHRKLRPLSPMEVSQLFKREIDAGGSLEDCAGAAGFIGTSMVSRFLNLLNLSAKVRHLVGWGQSGATIAFTGAQELSRLPADEQESACDAILREQFTTLEVRQLVQLRLRSKKPISSCVEEILRLRPRIERKHLFIGGIPYRDVQARLGQLTQVERDALIAGAVSALFPALHEVSTKLGTDRFTILVPEEAALILREGDFEGTIGKYLAGRLV